MNATSPPRPVVAAHRSLSGAQKVAALLLAVGRPRASQLLRRFEPEELKLISRSAADLPPISSVELEALVEEFASLFSEGAPMTGSTSELRDILSDVLTEEQLADVMGEKVDEPAADTEIWQHVGKIKRKILASYLSREHPQVAALVLSRLDSSVAAQIVGAFPAPDRATLVVRMLGIKQVSDHVVRALEVALKEDLLAAKAANYGEVAGILNKLNPSQTDALLEKLAEVRPEDAKALKAMIFKFDDLNTLDPKALTTLLDRVPMEPLALALLGGPPELQATLLAALPARSRRMVEAEMQSKRSVALRDVTAARADIVETVLRMVAGGEITLGSPSEEDL
jgi:flagellar motor switch protein FliG